MNSDSRIGEHENRRGRPLPRARPIAVPVEEELEFGEPIPDGEEPAPVAKRIPGLCGRFGTRSATQTRPAEVARSSGTDSPNNSSGGQMVLATAKYLQTAPEETSSRRRNKSRCQGSEQGERSLEARLLNGGVGGGMLAMGAAVIWFVIGLMNDVLFFYPPILFIIGLLAFFKGLANGEE